LSDVAYQIENDLAEGLDRPQIQKIEKESAMTSHRKVAYLILLSTLTLSASVTMQAQQRSYTTQTRQTYTPPPAPRPVERSEPQPEQRRIEPETRQESTPPNVQPENRQYSQPENRPSNNFQPESRPNPSPSHPNVYVVRPQVVTPVLRHAMTYNTRPNGVHIQPEYFAGHFGPAHGFHFNGWGPGCPACGFAQFNGEWYFNWNGANFGLMGPIPGNWALAADYLYVDIGDDGNYYLYDAQNPNVAVQLTFVQNLGDDQAGADQDQGNGSGE
jgi:hypothetical protein